MKEEKLTLRPLEREDLPFVHGLDNNDNVMRYWFEEPYEALVELTDIHQIHRNAEFSIIIAPDYQGRHYASQAADLALEYSFAVLNLYKLYLVVDKENEKAIHIYEKLGFESEGILRHEFYINGRYRDVIRMAIFKDDYLKRRQGGELDV